MDGSRAAGCQEPQTLTSGRARTPCGPMLGPLACEKQSGSPSSLALSKCSLRELKPPPHKSHRHGGCCLVPEQPLDALRCCDYQMKHGKGLEDGHTRQFSPSGTASRYCPQPSPSAHEGESPLLGTPGRASCMAPPFSGLFITIPNSDDNTSVRKLIRLVFSPFCG